MRVVDILIMIIMIVLIVIILIITITTKTMLTHTQVTPPAYLPAFLKPKKGMKATQQVPPIIMVCVIIVMVTRMLC